MQENKNIEAFRFGKVNIPSRIENIPNTDDKYVPDGNNNLYSNYELKLYCECPIHASIVNNKANYIIGKGLRLKGGEQLDIMVNPADSISEFLEKIILDLLIHNRFAVEVIYNVLNKPIEFHHVPVFKTRPNKSKTKFWYSEDWKMGKRPIIYDRYKKASNDSKSKMFYFDLYQPGENSVYPNPEYHQTIKSIETDIAIRDFNLNNIKNHFSASTLITFFMGTNADAQVKQAALDEINNSFTGENGGKVILDFQSPDGKAAEVSNLSPGDWDKAYEIISRHVVDDIIQGHGINSPSLFGIEIPGKLGGTSEQRDSYAIWKDNYVAKKRTQIQSALNMLFAEYETISGPVEFIDKPLPSPMNAETKEKIMTINELRAEQGLPTIIGGDRFIGEAAPSQPQAQPVAMSKEVIELTEEDFDKIKDMGIVRDEFEFIGEGEFVFSTDDANRIHLRFETEQEIADYITSKKLNDISVAELKTLIRKDLGINVSQDELKGLLSKISEMGLLNIEDSDGNLTIKPVESKGKTVEVMYAYEVREGKGAAIIETTRPFCRRLIQNNRVFTRAEIQRMNSIFGYNVFELAGGYYRDANTGEVTPFCRHKWKAYSVARRPKNKTSN